MNELIQELSRRRFVLGRETYQWETPWSGVFELRPIEPHIPGEFSRSLIEEEAPQIYPKVTG